MKGTIQAEICNNIAMEDKIYSSWQYGRLEKKIPCPVPKESRTFHKNVCDIYNIATTKQEWLHKPGPVTETEEVKILWDF